MHVCQMELLVVLCSSVVLHPGSCRPGLSREVCDTLSTLRAPCSSRLWVPPAMSQPAGHFACCSAQDATSSMHAAGLICHTHSVAPITPQQRSVPLTLGSAASLITFSASVGWLLSVARYPVAIISVHPAAIQHSTTEHTIVKSHPPQISCPSTSSGDQHHSSTTQHRTGLRQLHLPAHPTKPRCTASCITITPHLRSVQGV